MKNRGATLKDKRKASLLIRFLKEFDAHPLVLFDLGGGSFGRFGRDHADADALTSDMAAIGRDMHKVLERIDRG